ncbi:MAG: hypothetical protein K6C10_03350 [Prevotella sp.]|nr:hypothetical protein [Prevotella sp.]
MEPAKRIIVNTAVQYFKAVITTLIALYSTRLVLDALNITDYGIYSLIAGVVAMLGFITNALVITTQRHLSFYKGQNSTEFLRKFFANSLFIHIVFGLLIVIILLAIKGWLFSEMLNIEPSRVETAEKVYVISVFMLLATVLMSPFKALLIAHENIIFIVTIEILDSLIKLGLAIMLAYVTFDKLLVYAWMMAFIVFLNLLVFSSYSLVKFPECVILIRKRDLDIQHLKEVTGFASWTTYGMACVAARNQGTGVVLNHFWGTAINAAYGIAFQINAAISFLVTSILNAMNPQLMQAEGSGNREKMLSMAAMQSKYTTAILAVVIIPLIAEMPMILDLWLKEVPENTTLFCRFILLGFLFDQITLGLSSANQAIGNIRNFTLITYTPKLLYMIVIWFLIKQGWSVKSVMILWVIVELSVALIRIPYLHHKAGLDMLSYCKQVILPIIALTCAIVLTCWLCLHMQASLLRVLLTLTCSFIVGTLVGWLFVFNSHEKAFITKMIKELKKR